MRSGTEMEGNDLMARAPFNVLIIPYMRVRAEVHFCIFKRSDTGIWQFVAGGGEDDERPPAAAARELEEETGIRSDKCMALASMCHIAANNFSEKVQTAWGKAVIVIPVHTFAVMCKANTHVCLSAEHTEYKWCHYDEARERLHFDLDKTALYELNVRISSNDSE